MGRRRPDPFGALRSLLCVRRRRWGGGKYEGVVKDMKVGGGGNWPIKLRLEGYQGSAIILAARQHRQLGFDEDHKGANLQCLGRSARVREMRPWPPVRLALDNGRLS
jgi:hypothetical protein